MARGGDSQSESRGFEFHHRILDGDFSHRFLVKIVLMFDCKRPKINEKEAVDGPFLKQKLEFNQSRYCIDVDT